MTRLFIVILLVLATPALADPPSRHWGHGGGDWHRDSGSYHTHWYRPGDLATAFWGGVVGGWLGSVFAPRPEPEVVVVPSEPARTVEWCISRYRSYDPYDHTYLGFDGQRHGCP